MHRSADVVDEARQRQLGGAQAAAELRLGFVHLDVEPRLRERDRSRQPVRPRADDDCRLRYDTPAIKNARFSFSISRAITSRWIWFVPS